MSTNEDCITYGHDWEYSEDADLTVCQRCGDILGDGIIVDGESQSGDYGYEEAIQDEGDWGDEDEK